MKTPRRLPLRQKPTPATDQNEALRMIGAVLANVSVITGLLVAFGWKRSETHARALGIESNVLGMSTADYVLRSMRPVFTLLAVVVVAGLLWLWLEPRLRPAVKSRNLRVLALSWLTLPLVVVGLGYVWPVVSFYVFPLAVGGGIMLSCYVIQLRGRPAWDWRKVRLFAVAAGVLSLFWAALNYAQVDGQRLADEFVASEAPAVTIYSQERMHITAPGVREDPLDGDRSRYRYRYSGLRLLENTGGKYFLVSDGWTRNSGVVVVLRDDASTRLELSR
ncbi:hypothetical protein SAMN04488074_104288 [Lentzea albidocapillata subsp. violacea]|uniref:Uncharacterized protein n=1 Tax=Lentzea albidocapillata subsp. violacea TaxID=128104 RepID=A0A1G8Z9L4_9PSEU|nr:hypothetical protein [Lentzea albidocapillata]SDK11751.1 hypothetical protein SAMN04488074_104288 [Lentzea albidocapillata subsp. violacea]